MNYKAIIFLCVVAFLACVVGCMRIMDLYPAPISKDLYTYTGNDPNKLRWESLGLLKDLSNQATLKHQLTQTDIEYAAKKDNLIYSNINSVATTAIEQTEAERNRVFGAGGIADVLLASIATGGGVWALAKKVLYTEQEYQAALQTPAPQQITNVPVSVSKPVVP